MNEAVIWDTIITNPSADHLQNIGPAAMKKLVRSAKGKSVDPSRYVRPFLGVGDTREDLLILAGFTEAKSSSKTRKQNTKSLLRRASSQTQKTSC